MLQLVNFIGRNRFFIVFLLLEALCFWFLVNSNNSWNVAYFNSTNAAVANVSATTNSVKEFVSLRDVNTTLAEENRQLREMLTKYQESDPKNTPQGYKPDSAFVARYKFVTIAKVIDNPITKAENYFTINKGSADGVKEGMGVITPNGIAGKVKFCNENFSLVTSVLHTENKISAQLQRSKEIGTATWNGRNASIIQLNDISGNTKIFKGDTVVTSELNAVFPSGVTLGRVVAVRMASDQAHKEADIALGNNFRKLSYVYLVENKLLNKQEAVQKSIETPNK